MGIKRGKKLKNYTVSPIDNAIINNSDSYIIVQKKQLKENPLEILKKLITQIKNECNLSTKDIQQLVNEEPPKETIPISLFGNNNLTAFETIVKYLRENQHKTYDNIAETLNRGKTTIALTYKRAKEKLDSKFELAPSKFYIPIKEFQNRTFSILEVIVVFLKNKNLSNHEVAVLLHRDDRTIWTVYFRAKKKIQSKSKTQPKTEIIAKNKTQSENKTQPANKTQPTNKTQLENKTQPKKQTKFQKQIQSENKTKSKKTKVKNGKR